MREWLSQQWNEIQGNVKYYALVLLGSAIVTAVVAITHGLQLWQQVWLAALFLLMLMVLVVAIVPRASRRPNPGMTLAESTFISEMWVRWSALADTYARLDYDNRNNDSTRLPFNSASWPQFGETWTYVHAQLYKLAHITRESVKETNELIQAFGWQDAPPVPSTDESAIMVDFVRQARELQAYLNTKSP